MNWWKRIFKTSGLIGLSKIVGFARDLMIAAYFGTSISADAFNFAYLFTGNIFILLGGLNGPFHSATVSTLSQIEGKNNIISEDNIISKQNLFLNQIFVQVFLFFVFLCLLLIAFLTPIGHLVLPSNLKLILSFNTQIYLMLPLLALAGLIGILFGAVSYKGDYFIPSLSPLISSFALILCLIFAYQFWGEWVLGIGTALGAILQTIVQFIDLSKYNFNFAFKIPFEKNDNLNYFYAILLPALLSSTIGSLNVYVDSFFTSSLEQGSWTAILLGNRLIQLPFGILVGASLISFLPRISACKEDNKQFENTLNTEINNLFFLMIPATALMLALSEPIIKLLFERGEFTAHSTYLVNLVLIGLSFSLLTALPREIYTRAFYALGDSKTPLIASIISIFFNALFDWWLAPKFAVAGIALSTTITTAINSLLMIILLKQKMPSLKINYLKILPFIFLGIIIFFLAKFSFAWSSSYLSGFTIKTFLNWQILFSLGFAFMLSLILYFGSFYLIKKQAK